MPNYSVPAYDLSIYENAIMLDTNVLVNAFCPTEQFHSDADYFIKEWDAQFLVSAAVAVETWGFIVGSRGNWEAGFNFLAWLLDPNPGKNVHLLPAPDIYFDNAMNLVKSLHIDCVDALLLQMAHEISSQCNMKPFVQIASYDTKDLTKQQLRGSVKFLLLDMRSLELY